MQTVSYALLLITVYVYSSFFSLLHTLLASTHTDSLMKFCSETYYQKKKLELVAVFVVRCYRKDEFAPRTLEQALTLKRFVWLVSIVVVKLSDGGTQV